MQNKMNKQRVIACIAVVVLFGAGIIGNKIVNKQPKIVAATAAVDNGITVNTVQVTSIEKNIVKSYNSTLESSDKSMLSSKVSAKVTKILFNDGDTVKTGQPMIVLDTQDINNQLKVAENQLAAAQNRLNGANLQISNNGTSAASSDNQLKNANNQLDSAKNQLAAANAGTDKLQLTLNNAQITYDSTKTLFDAGAVSKSELDNAELALNTAKTNIVSNDSNVAILKAGVDTATNNVEEAKNTIKKSNDGSLVVNNSVTAAKIAVDAINITINNLKETLANTVVKSPSDGIVDGRNVMIGQMVSAGSPLAYVKNIDIIDAVINIQQQDTSNISVGDKAYVVVNGTDQYTGTVKSINSSADPSTRMFSAKIAIDNLSKILKPGVFATVNVKSKTKTNILQLPVEALVGTDGAYYVYTNENGVAHKNVVKIGEVTDKLVDVLSGLKDGSQVITTNTQALSEGAKINVTNGQGE